MSTTKPGTRPVTKVLVANRGEIALRVMRTCRRMGIRTVAVFSDADRDAPHVAFADEAVHIGPSPAKESYLVVEKILAAARASKADAVHPGYGFLSENAEFSRACDEAGLVFVGPGAEAVRLMGNKRIAKLRMIDAGVPCIPGYEGEDQSVAKLAQEAARIGYPVMIKASAGGGGRGMRLVHEASAFEDAARSAKSEAENAFGSGELILEKAVVAARHVEIQVFADAHGNVVHLGERDCSVQRRNQKVVEESPSPDVTPELRERMGAIAKKAAHAIAYLGAGTLEFLLAPNGEFYFMEMNTRLQVEHPVTEAITGLDLVEWQIRVARGEPLPLAQDAVRFSGHAIEVRLCAEDPAHDYLPQTGKIARLALPPASLARVDHGVREGQILGPHYDSMQGKIIVHGETREEARQKLAEALRQLVFFGTRTNATLLSSIVAHPAFGKGAYDTHFLPTSYTKEALAKLHTPDESQIALAAAALYRVDADALADEAKLGSGLGGWNSAFPYAIPVRLSVGDTTHTAMLSDHGSGRLVVRLGATTLDVRIVRGDTRGELRFERDGVIDKVHAHRDGATLWLHTGDATFAIDDVTYRGKASANAEGDGRLVAPIDGKVLRVVVEKGASVKKGELLLVLEAMKMEFSIVAPFDGTVETLSVAANAQVGARAVLAIVKKLEATDATAS